MATVCAAQESLVGTYTLVAVTRIIDGKLQEMKGKPPHGYVVITPKHYLDEEDNTLLGVQVSRI